MDAYKLGLIVVGLALLFVIRPLAGNVSFVGTGATWAERAVIAFFRHPRDRLLLLPLARAGRVLLPGDGTGRRRAATVGVRRLLASIVLHGITASPVMKRLEARQRPTGASREPESAGES